jgi:hypothetical protein
MKRIKKAPTMDIEVRRSDRMRILIMASEGKLALIRTI